VIKSGEDRRFREIKKSALRFLVAWTLQGVWIFVTLIPSLLMWEKNMRLSRPTSTLAVVGWLYWAFGFLLETTADIQKSIFRANPDNKDKFISSGVWLVCRHPNYLGEIILWCGLFISASATYSRFDYFAILCPIFDAILICFVSGVPILEANAEKKWGANQEYQNYKARTKVLIPFIW